MAKTVTATKTDEKKERDPISIGDRPRLSQEDTDEQRKNRLRAAEQRLEDAKNAYIVASNLQPGTSRFMDDLRSVAQMAGISTDETHEMLKGWISTGIRKKVVEAEDAVKEAGGKVLKPGESDEDAKKRAIEEANIRGGNVQKVQIVGDDTKKK